MRPVLASSSCRALWAIVPPCRVAHLPRRAHDGGKVGSFHCYNRLKVGFEFEQPQALFQLAIGVFLGNLSRYAVQVHCKLDCTGFRYFRCGSSCFHGRLFYVILDQFISIFCLKGVIKLNQAGAADCFAALKFCPAFQTIRVAAIVFYCPFFTCVHYRVVIPVFAKNILYVNTWFCSHIRCF